MFLFYILFYTHMELKFTGMVEMVYPIRRSWGDKKYPRLPIKVKWVGMYYKNFWLFSLHGDIIEQYPVKEWDVVDIYYRMNTGVYPDTGTPHWSNNIIRIVTIEDHYEPSFF